RACAPGSRRPPSSGLASSSSAHISSAPPVPAGTRSGVAGTPQRGTSDPTGGSVAPLSITRAGVAGTVLALAVALVCARLGIWQLDRLEQRRQLNAVMEERLAGATIALADVPRDTTGLLYRTVESEGRYDVARSIVLRGRAHEGMPGVHVLTPLRLPDGSAVLVNRGWVPSADAATVDLDALPPPASGRVTGLALPFHTDGAAVVEDGAFRVTW